MPAQSNSPVVHNYCPAPDLLSAGENLNDFFEKYRQRAVWLWSSAIVEDLHSTHHNHPTKPLEGFTRRDSLEIQRQKEQGNPEEAEGYLERKAETQKREEGLNPAQSS
ncbi:MAG: hypothetical protein P1V97_11190 [Planctomycetota bacterium]|nr:hypothetical protein [Planctomycetota bacterium]